MRLSDFLQNVGHPVAYYAGLARVIGVKECVFVCQLAYWTDKQQDQDGWIFKHHDDFTKETGLSYEEQKTARRNLKQLGILREKVNRLKHETAYMLDCEILNSVWDGHFQPEVANATSRSGKVPLPKGQSLSPEVAFATSSNGTESTTESTPKNTQPFLALEKIFPQNLDTEEFKAVWSDWEEDRKQRRKPITRRAAELQLASLSKWGPDKAIAAIKLSIEKGWQGLFEPTTNATAGRENGNVPLWRRVEFLKEEIGELESKIDGEDKSRFKAELERLKGLKRRYNELRSQINSPKA